MRMGMPDNRGPILQNVSVCFGLIENRDGVLVKQTVGYVKLSDQTGPFKTDFWHRIKVCFSEILEALVLIETYVSE
jgi:hypothetical protein